MTADKAKDRGSLTLEAALVMPLFVVIFVSVISLIRLVYTQQTVQCAISQAAKAVARLSYISAATGLYDMVENAEEGIKREAAETIANLGCVKQLLEFTGAGDQLHRFIGSFVNLPAEEIKSAVYISAVKAFVDHYLEGVNTGMLGIKGGIGAIDYRGSSFLQDQDVSIQIVAEYEADIPLLTYLQGRSHIVQRAATKPWFGSEGLAVKSACAADDDIWSLGNLERGRRIRGIFNANLPLTYPVISDFREGTAKMIKSIDLTAEYYQSSFNAEEKITGYINELASYRGTISPWGSEEIMIMDSDITTRVLLLVIPGNNMTAEMEGVLGCCRANALRAGIILDIEKYGMKAIKCASDKLPFK